MIELLILLVLLIVALGLGNRALPLFRISFDCFMEEQLACAGLGFGILILATIALAATHILNPTSISGLLILSAILGRKPLLFAISRSKAGIKSRTLSFTRTTTLFLTVLAIMALFNLIGALAPATDTDGLAYHLAVPKFYLSHNGFAYNPIMVFNWPLSIEMLYTIAIAISTDTLAKLIHFLFGLFCVLAVYIISKEWFGKPAGQVAAILFYAMPLVGLESGIAYVDLATTFYTVIGMLYFMRWYLDSKPTLLLSAIFIGIASSTKWNGPITILILLLFCLHKRYFQRSRGTLTQKQTSATLSLILLFILISSSFSLIWYAKNTALTGNPVAPFLGNWIPTRDWGPENTKAYQASVGSLYVSPLHFMFIPFALTLHGRPFGELTYLGPWFLMLLPLAFIAGRWPKPVYFIFISSILYYAVWFLTSQQSRLLLPTLALLCAVCGWVFWHDRLTSIRPIMTVILLFSVILALPFTMIYNGKGALVSLGLENRQDFLQRLLPNAETLGFANTHLSAESKLLLVRENHGFLLDHDYLWGDAAMQGVLEFKHLDPPSLLNRLQELGITDIVVNRAISCADPKDEERHCPDITGLLTHDQTKDHIHTTFEKNKVALYHLSYHP